MYRVVLIDDESIIVEGLRRVVKWADYGCQVVGTAEDGQSGAALIRQLRPHMLFTDIRMPGEDGLTMLAGLRSEFPDMQVTVLTGYRDFSYAQEAIRLGVTRFLLKPSKMDEIHEALAAMKTHLDQLPPEETAEAEESESQQQAGNFLVKQAVAYIQEHYREELSNESIGARFGFHKNYVSDLIKTATGRPLHQYLLYVRLSHAWEMLEAGEMSIAQIAGACGFADMCYFSRYFKQVYGHAPSYFRTRSAGL